MIRSIFLKAGLPTLALGAVTTPESPAITQSILPFDLQLGGVALLGVTIGAMIRVGQLISKSSPWSDIKRDVMVSTLIGFGNAIFVLWLHKHFEWDPLQLLAAAVVAGTLGLRAISMITNAAQKLYMMTIDRLLDERSKMRDEMIEREGQLRNEMQATISEMRVSNSEKNKKADNEDPLGDPPVF